MPDKTIPNVGCDIYLSGAWWAYRDRKMHAIELGYRLRSRSAGEIKIHDRETDEILLVLEDRRLHYVGEEVPLPQAFDDIWPKQAEP